MTCVACGATNPAGAEWCGLCLVRFDAPPPPPEPPVIHVAGDEVGTPSYAFRRTASTTLRRMYAGGPLSYVEPGGELQAVVTQQKVLVDGRGREDRYTCVDTTDEVLFFVEPYRAVDRPAWTVFEVDGEPLATMIAAGGVPGQAMEVRDGTGAPVASLRRTGSCFDVIETGGAQIGQVWRQPTTFQTVIDEEWGLTVFAEPRVLGRDALVALPLVCWIVWGRAARPRADMAAATPSGRFGDIEVSAGVDVSVLLGDFLP